MGIHGLMKLLTEECPEAIKELADMENLTGRKIAIDASMALYQFLVAVRSSGPGGSQAQAMLTNEAGDVTSHIQGMFNRTIKMMTSGIKPCYVFDGKAPEMKGGELAKRTAKRAKAQSDLEAATANDNIEDMDKFNRRLVKVTRQHNVDCQELLKLMGVPYIIAPCEAEAQCAELAKKGKVYATATEDMDALTFRTPKLLRKLTFSQGKDKQPIIEIDMEAVLRGLQLSYEQFVDLCILCGCDYCTTIKGIGPKTALKLIRTHKTLEAIIAYLQHNEKKYEIPADWRVIRIPKDELLPTTDSAISARDDEGNDNEDDAEVADEEEEQLVMEILQEKQRLSESNDDAENGCEKEPSIVEKEPSTDDLIVDASSSSSSSSLVPAVDAEEVEIEGVEYEDVPPLYQQARGLFTHADVHAADDVELKWNAPDEAGLKAFLVDKMGFSAERVMTGIKKLQEAQQKKSQQRMDSFFTAAPKPVTDNSNSGVKRKAVEVKGKGKATTSSTANKKMATGKRR